MSGSDPADLMVRWLREWLHLIQDEGFLVNAVRDVRLGQSTVAGEGLGERRDRGRHLVLREVKGITYHAAGIERDGDRWRARVILDV